MTIVDGVEDRLAALEAAVGELRAAAAAARPADASPSSDPDAATDDLWLLTEIRRRFPAGAVTFGGTATVGKGEVAWQWTAKSDRLLEQDWEGAAAVLDALSHPVRLRLLQRVLNGITTTAELSEDPALGTTGQLHHHLRALVAAGWLSSTGRGQWAVSPPRVIPLLAIVSATTT